jgi:hypothetical protein
VWTNNVALLVYESAELKPDSPRHESDEGSHFEDNGAVEPVSELEGATGSPRGARFLRAAQGSTNTLGEEATHGRRSPQHGAEYVLCLTRHEQNQCRASLALRQPAFVPPVT